MSFVTTVILVFSGSEDEEERIREVNSFSYRNLSLDIRSVESVNVEPFTAWYGGTKSIIGPIYIGSYNHFDVASFLAHLGTVKWDDPKYVQVLIRNENEWNYSLYGDAGRELIYKAIEQ
ncbi:MAG: hypothetical protein QY309_10130 [Cyclobacteriaceae bacterium]|nr:MAG: hypothetical protein QY309_10130 [Cyclobacteriaceae bacterium]